MYTIWALTTAENLSSKTNWPLPNGVSYNSYLITDEKCALIDTLEFGSKDDYLECIESLLNGKKLDYLIINHMEPDHSSMTGLILSKYPEVKIVANNKAFKMLEGLFRSRKRVLYMK